MPTPPTPAPMPSPPQDLVPAPAPVRLPIAHSAHTFPVRRVWCVARNYQAHAAEMGGPSTPAPPFFFTKPTSALLPEATVVPYPPATTALHHEVELLIGLGGGGRDLTLAEAAACVVVAGVAVDLTRRAAQSEAKRRGRPWALAKGFDHAAPCGALLRVEGPVAADATLRLWVDDELRQEGRVADMIADQAQLLSALSQQVRLAPGDVLLTGTPAGVGPLTAGQRVRAEITGFPPLAFTVGGADSAAQAAGDVQIDDVLETWFGPAGADPAGQFGLWFGKDPAQDERLRQRFEVAVQRASRGELDHWATTPRGRLALVILLDQLSRNLYRDTPAAFAQDAKARQLAVAGMAQGHDAALSPVEAVFLYLPLEHGESLAWQERSVAAFEGLLLRDDSPLMVNFLKYAHSHKDAIERFGRYPHRNRILGRQSTAEELAYLADGGGF